jgi:hypothetical protein
VDGIKAGYIDPPRFEMYTGKDIDDKHILYCKLNMANLSGWPSAVRNQLKIEGIRKTLAEGQERAFWEPYLKRAERIIDGQLAIKQDDNMLYDESLTYEDVNMIFVGFDTYAYDFIINSLLERAAEDYARRLGKELDREPPEPPKPPFAGEAPEFREVVLSTPDGKGTILIVPKTIYLIALRVGEPPPYVAIAPGERTSCRGVYAYKIRYDNGSESEVKYVRFDVSGNFHLT